MQKWEYHRIEVREEEGLVERLNALGQEGWELVSLQWRVRHMEERTSYDRVFDGEVVAYLKRPTQDPSGKREVWAV